MRDKAAKEVLILQTK